MKTEQIIYIKRNSTSFDLRSNLYQILLFKSEAKFSIDLVDYSVSSNHIVFLSPYQNFRLFEGLNVCALSFHADFYCIEYHKKEVACNGILFNNIYETPYVYLSENEFLDIEHIFSKIDSLQDLTQSYDISLKKTYLQLILALCSKQKLLSKAAHSNFKNDELFDFKLLIEQHFTENRNISFYAEQFHLTNDAFSKKVKSIYGKPPSILIKERLILEAKKLLHLTYKNINEIAFELGFSDEFHFSKYFKNEVGISPKHYRDEVGISIVAK